MDLINIPNTTNNRNKTKTLVDAIYAAGTATSKTANSATNGVKETKSLGTIANDMEEAKSLDTIINVMEEAYKRSRNFFAIIKAKERCAIGKDPWLPPLLQGGKRKVKLTELNIINKALEKAETKAMDLMGIPKSLTPLPGPGSCITSPRPRIQTQPPKSLTGEEPGHYQEPGDLQDPECLQEPEPKGHLFKSYDYLYT